MLYGKHYILDHANMPSLGRHVAGHQVLILL